jgi:hypothetical protein
MNPSTTSVDKMANDIKALSDQPITHPDPNHPLPRPHYPEPKRPRPGLPRQQDPSDKPVTHPDSKDPPPRPLYPDPCRPRSGLPRQIGPLHQTNSYTTEVRSDEPIAHPDPNHPPPRPPHPEPKRPRPRPGLPRQADVGNLLHSYAAKFGSGFPKGDEQPNPRMRIRRRDPYLGRFGRPTLCT